MICTICKKREAVDRCVSCGRHICSSCSIIQIGVCLECTSCNPDEMISMLRGCGALQFGKFILASGRESYYYVDIKKAVTQPSILKKIAERMAPSARGYDRIAGMELGAVPIAAALSLETSIPYIIVRKERKEHGTQKDFEGELNKGEKVVFVEDVTTTANTLKGGITRIRNYGGIVEKALVVVDREEGARENLGEIRVQLIPLVKASHLLQE